MAFSFGGSSNAPAPGPAPAAGGFSFGGATPAPAAPAPAGGFSFGGAPAAPAPAAPAPGGFGAPAPAAGAPATGGFSFGGAPSTPAPAPGAPAPAGGFSFGGAPAAVPAAPAPGGFGSAPAAPPAAGGFSFGGSSAPAAPAPAAPAPGGFSFGGSSAPAPATTGALVPAASTALTTTTSTALATTPPSTLEVPSFDETFGGFRLWTRVQQLCQQGTDLAGQELVHLVSSSKESFRPKPPEWKTPDQQLRQRLAQAPTITMREAADPSTASPKTYQTSLTQKAMERILSLSNDLRLGEAEATCLYAQVSSELDAMKAITHEQDLLSQAGITKNYSPTNKTAREFYFFEKHLTLRTLLFLFQSRLSNEPGILLATDELLKDGLVPRLIKLILDYTHSIVRLLQELSANKVAVGAPGAPPMPAPGPSNHQNFAQAHLLFCQQERRVAAEILFFVAYHTQWTPEEAGALLDLIKDLTPLLAKPCPFANVPSPYETTNTPAPAQWGAAPYAPKEKGFFEWQQELVVSVHKSGQPQLLQCVSLLVVAAMAVLDSRQVLYDRDTHSPNAFGRGNAFLPPDASSHDTPGVKALHQRLAAGVVAEQWGRTDVGGLLSASYVLMLRSAPLLLSSPRGGSRSEYALASRDLSTPADLQSFTFARLTLLPALQRMPASSGVCGGVAEFGLSVVAETFAAYLEALPEGQLPLSRQRWVVEEEEELRLRRENRARHRQFLAWQSQGGVAASSSSSAAEEAIPAAVDLLTRPDCLDDLVALAVDLCGLGPDYSRCFWGTDPSTGAPVLCRTIRELGRYQKKDDSLLPCYLSWLAAMANDEKSAASVHQLLSQPPEEGAATTSAITWTKLVFNLRWYAQELSPYDTEVVKKSNNQTSTSSSSARSTSYYYNLEGNAVEPNARSSSASQAKSATTTTSSATGSSSSATKIKELSDTSRYNLSAHLAVIKNLVAHSPEAKHAILKITLPIGGEAIQEGDEALLVLFKLAIAPLPPTIRGATLATIAALLTPPPSGSLQPEEEAFLKEQAKHGWEYLETCPLLPIFLLDQYSALNARDARASQVGLAFPPSSSALANAETVPSLLPKDPTYGLFYETEHVESRMGWYPSTEGFLELLTALVCAGGCPSGLGQNWRLRAGCAPYFEYVLDFVLPRVLGIHNKPTLPFRVKGDQSRLLSKALAVLEAVLSRYTIPLEALPIKTRVASIDASALGIHSIAASVVLKDPHSVVQDLASDFRNLPVATSSPPDANPASSGVGATAVAAPPSVNIPRAKSPGFAILSDLLSSAGGTLFQAIALILTDHGGARSIASIFGGQGDSMALAYATFGATPPNTTSAIEGAKDGGVTKPKQTLLKGLTPVLKDVIMDSSTFDDGVRWRERSIVLSLQIMCAAAVREEAFFQAITLTRESLKIVPVLRFEQNRYGSSNLRVAQVAPMRIANLLFTTNNAQYIRSALVEYIGYRGSNDALDASLSASALAMVYFMNQKMPPTTSIQSLCGNQAEKTLSGAVASRLLASSKQLQTPIATEATSLILRWLLENLIVGSAGVNGLVRTLLGLPSTTYEGNWRPNWVNLSNSLDDCFDAILELLQDPEFVTSQQNSGVVSSCHEIIYRLYNLLSSDDSSSVKIVVYTAERLRSVDFWTQSLLVWFSQRGSEPLKQTTTANLSLSMSDSLNSMAWLLKGLACELNLLVGFAGHSAALTDAGLASLLSPRPQLFGRLLELLLTSEEALMQKLTEGLPLDKPELDPSLRHPPEDVLRSCVEHWQGPLGLRDGYDRLNVGKVEKLIKGNYSNEDFQSMVTWCQQWNALVARNAASANLTDATCTMLDCATTSMEAFRASAFDQSGGVQTDILLNLLSSIVHRLLENSETGRGMDSFFNPSASRNIANAILVITEALTNVEKSHQPSEADLLMLASQVSKTIVFSGLGDASDAETPTRNERTTVLGSALSLLLQAAAGAEPDLINQFGEDFLLAAQTMGRLAIVEIRHSSDETSIIVSTIARSILRTIVETCSTYGASMGDSLVFNLFSKSFTKSTLALVAGLDSNICLLLQSIASQPHGGEVLMNAGVCDALESAAKAYSAEEARIMATVGTAQLGFSKAKLVSPEFLMGHLKLLNALMSSSSLSRSHFKTLSERTVQILAHYRFIVQRLCFNFPSEVDLLRCFLRCLVQATTLAYPADLGERHAELTSTFNKSFKDLFAESRFFESGIVMLCHQLIENPLPRSLLPPPPQVLNESRSASPRGVVRVENDEKNSWYDVLEAMLEARDHQSNFSFSAPVGSGDFGYWGTTKPKRWSENKFEYAIIATDVLSLMMTLLKKLNRFEVLEGPAVARGLYFYSLASQTIETRLGEVQQRIGGSSNMLTESTSVASLSNPDLEEEYLRQFGASVASCVEQLLVAAYNMIPEGSKENTSGKFQKGLRIAIEQSGLDKKGIGCLASLKDGATRAKLGEGLAAQMLKELGVVV